MKNLFLSILLAVTMASPALAVQPDEILDDPALEARARELGQLLRCVVCQNQPIDDSNAELARDMRLLVRKRLVEGDSNAEVVDYMVSRYGDFVLLKPPFKPTTFVLWFGPLIIVAIGVVAVFAFFRRKTVTTGETPLEEKPRPLSPEEKRRLEKLMKDEAP